MINPSGLSVKIFKQGLPTKELNEDETATKITRLVGDR